MLREPRRGEVAPRQFGSANARGVDGSGVRHTAAGHRLRAKDVTGAPQDRLDPCTELARAEGLGHEVVRASLEALDGVDLFAQGSQHDDVGGGDRTDLPSRLETVHSRHVHVERRDEGRMTPHRLEPVQSVRRRVDLEAPLSQHGLEEISDVGVILDDDGYAGFRIARHEPHATGAGASNPARSPARTPFRVGPGETPLKESRLLG